MLKKILLISVALIFGASVLFTSVWKTSAQTLQQREVVGEEVAAVESEEKKEEADESDKKSVDYALLWPGILPDHFLYPIKMIRDRIWLWLTIEPLKKSELLLSFADKRIWAAQMLVDKGEVDLGVSTATKAEKYLESAIQQEEIAQQEGKETKAFLERLAKAAQKHEEILLDMREKVDDSAQINFSLEYTRRAYKQARQRLGE